MYDEPDVVDYIKEVRMILADSIDTLLNLQHDVSDVDDEIVPVNSAAELVDMGYDVSHSERLKRAESDFLKREQF